MKIAYLILCHHDATHIDRLVRRLISDGSGNAAFIHVDQKSDMQDDLIRRLQDVPNAFVVEERYKIYWGGFAAVRATYALLRAAVSNARFDRYVLLQGADYPAKSNEYITGFFDRNTDVEYIRAVNSAMSTKKYFYAQARYPLLFDRPNFLKKVHNKLVRVLDLKLKPQQWDVDGKPWSVYWGCAQFAVTHACVELFLKYENNEALVKHFADVFPADETFFHTIVYNSELISKTTKGRAETDEEIHTFVDMVNLTYFEYPILVTVFNKDDFQKIVDLPHLYVRKVHTAESTALLDMLDRSHGVMEPATATVTQVHDD